MAPPWLTPTSGIGIAAGPAAGCSATASGKTEVAVANETPACGGGTNEAVTACTEFIVTLQPAVPEQAWSHPPNVEGCVAAAVSTTMVPVG